MGRQCLSRYVCSVNNPLRYVDSTGSSSSTFSKQRPRSESTVLPGRLKRPHSLEVALARRSFHVIVERDEDGWYVGCVAELPGCHTQAKWLNQLRDRIREAIEAYIGPRRSVPKGITFVGVQTVEV